MSFTEPVSEVGSQTYTTVKMLFTPVLIGCVLTEFF